MTENTDFRVDVVCKLLASAVGTDNATEAMKFTQAALNAVYAIKDLSELRPEQSSLLDAQKTVRYNAGGLK